MERRKEGRKTSRSPFWSVFWEFLPCSWAFSQPLSEMLHLWFQLLKVQTSSTKSLWTNFSLALASPLEGNISTASASVHGNFVKHVLLTETSFSVWWKTYSLYPWSLTGVIIQIRYNPNKRIHGLNNARSLITLFDHDQGCSNLCLYH